MKRNALTEDMIVGMVEALLPILSKRAVIFFTGGSGKPETLTKQVDDLLLLKSPIVVSESFRRQVGAGFLRAVAHRLAQTNEQVYSAVTQADLAVIPILTRNTLAKAALGISDTPVTYGIAHALTQGKPVVAIKGSCASSCRNPAYGRMLEGHEAVLQSFGVQFVEGCDFSSALKERLYPGIFSNGQRKSAPTGQECQIVLEASLITYADIQAVPPQASVVILQNARITPFAKDFLDARRVTLIRR